MVVPVELGTNESNKTKKWDFNILTCWVPNPPLMAHSVLTWFVLILFKIFKVFSLFKSRHGGEDGVTCHVIAVDSKSEQAAWATSLVSSALAAARRVKKWVTSATYKTRLCELTVDIDEGFCPRDEDGNVVFSRLFQGI